MTITYSSCGRAVEADTITANLPITKRVEGQVSAATVQIQLAANAVMSLTPSRRGSVRITGVSGTLWITQQGDSKDYVMSATGTFTSDARGKVVVQAIGAEAVLRLLEA